MVVLEMPVLAPEALIPGYLGRLSKSPVIKRPPGGERPLASGCNV